MRRASSWLSALGSCLLAAGAYAADPPTPTAAAEGVQPAAAVSTPADPELQRMLERLSQLSEHLGHNPQAPDSYRYQLSQAEVLVQLAVRGKAEERDRWLRMTVDSLYGAALQSPDGDGTALQRLQQMPARIASAYPESPLAAYAALQEIKVRYNRAIVKAGENPSRYQEYYCTLLLRFAQDYPRSEEAPKAVIEAGEIWEALGKPDEARHCYRYLLGAYAGKPVARKAGGALWRLGLGGEPVNLKLPLLYSAGDQTFDLAELRGKLVVVYFWSSSSPQAEEDLQALKTLSDHHRARGLEIVQVNMDAEPGKAREYLSGRLTAGQHVHQRGGLDGPVAERYGISSLPQTFLVDKDGKLLNHCRQPASIEAEINGALGGGK